jgi:hypothetical protein
MERSDGDVLSAEVVLRGVPGDDVSPISSANLSSREPAPESAAKVRDWFARHGFMTSDVHGVSITVTGPRGLFEEVRMSGPGPTSWTCRFRSTCPAISPGTSRSSHSLHLRTSAPGRTRDGGGTRDVAVRETVAKDADEEECGER